MNQQPFEEMIRKAVDRALQSGTPKDVEALLSRVLDDPDMKLYLRGIEEHDRSEGLEEVYVRDIRTRIERDLRGE